MSIDNQHRLTQQTEKDTTNVERKQHYIPDKINEKAYADKFKGENKAQEIGMHANWDIVHENN